MEDSVIFNSKYILNINPKTIDYKKYDNYDAGNIKEFIESQNIDSTSKNSWGKFSNDNFINNIFKSGESENILSIYIISFIKVIESINILFKALLENSSIIPYSMKCICKIIYVLLKKKFPNIKRLQLNSFISRFFSIIVKKASKVPHKSKLAYRKAPKKAPINKELYTSLVTKASTIAKRGGIMEYHVPKNIELLILLPFIIKFEREL